MTFLSISTFFCTNIRHITTFFRTNTLNFLKKVQQLSKVWTHKKNRTKNLSLVRGLPEMGSPLFIFFRAKTCCFHFFVVTLPQTIIRQTWSTRDYHTECQTIHGLDNRTTTVQTKPCIYRRWKKPETSSTLSVHADLARVSS